MRPQIASILNEVPALPLAFYSPLSVLFFVLRPESQRNRASAAMDPEKGDSPTDISKDNDIQSDSKPIADHVEASNSENGTRVGNQTEPRDREYLADHG